MALHWNVFQMPPKRNSWNEISAMISSVRGVENRETKGGKREDSDDVMCVCRDRERRGDEERTG